MSKPVVRVCPFSVGDCPTVTRRRKRSFVSSTRLQVMVSGSMASRTNLHQHRGTASLVWAVKKCRAHCTCQPTRSQALAFEMHVQNRGDAHLSRSSSVRSSGSVFAMPSFFSRVSITGAKLFFPS